MAAKAHITPLTFKQGEGTHQFPSAQPVLHPGGCKTGDTDAGNTAKRL